MVGPRGGAFASAPGDAGEAGAISVSLGGSVAFWVPLHYPTRFAGAAPLCGYPNILEYRTVRSAKKKPWEAQLLDDDGRWADLPDGRVLGDGAQLRLGAGAQFSIRHSVSERVQVRPAPADRLVQLKVTKVPAHGT